jgi:hypothetical protein
MCWKLLLGLSWSLALGFRFFFDFNLGGLSSELPKSPWSPTSVFSMLGIVDLGRTFSFVDLGPGRTKFDVGRSETFLFTFLQFEPGRGMFARVQDFGLMVLVPQVVIFDALQLWALYFLQLPSICEYLAAEQIRKLGFDLWIFCKI